MRNKFFTNTNLNERNFIVNARINKNYLSGFTFLEVLLVLILLSGISVYLLKLTNLFSSDYYILKSTTDNIKKSTETARERAALGDKGENWGVIFFNTTTEDYFYIFAGNNFATATSSEIVYLNKSLNLENIPLGSTTEIVFEKFKGETATSSQIVLKSTNINKSYEITISKYGVVNFTAQ